MKTNKSIKDVCWQFGHYWVAGVFLAFIGAVFFKVATVPGLIVKALLDQVHRIGWVGSVLHSILLVIVVLLVPFIFGWILHRAVINLSPLHTLLAGWVKDADAETEKAEKEADQASRR